MKNAQLDQLTEMAKDVADGIPSPLYKGDGGFYNEKGEPLSVEGLLSDMHAAKERAEELHISLKNQPRRKVS